VVQLDSGALLVRGREGKKSGEWGREGMRNRDAMVIQLVMAE